MTLLSARLAGDHLEPYITQADNLSEFALSEPEGVYTVLRTYHGDQAVLMDRHLDRLEESARLEGHEIHLNRRSIRQAIGALVQQAGFSESRVRITVPYNSGRELYISLEPLNGVSPAARRNGVCVSTLDFVRSNPKAKSNAFLFERQKARESMARDSYEGIILGRSGEMLEGLSSNFYAVQDKRLRTADEGVLHGISRYIVLQVARSQGVEVAFEPARRSEIASLSEAFITSSSRGVLPVVKIDDQPIRDQRPGDLTFCLMDAYDEWVSDHIEPLT